MSKFICVECKHRLIEGDMLIGLNPFKDEEIFGCPKCKAINNFEKVCDHIDCWEYVSTGTPTSDGYKFLCGAHRLLLLSKINDK